ncbi:MAG: DUF4405 domain-containing protein [Candidatus Omnitrophota bacterium]
MNKAIILRIVNIALFLSFITQAITAFIILFNINTPYPQFILEVHEYNGIFLIIAIVTHITLNWGWIKVNFFKKQ